MQLLDGKLVSNNLKIKIKEEVDILKQTKNIIPKLVAILVGNNPASATYVASKAKNCAEVGFASETILLDDNISESLLIEKIQSLNKDNSVHGILVQLPLPKSINESNIIHAIDPRKDVDGFHPINLGKMMLGEPTFISATPYGVLLLLEYYGIKTSGMNCVVIGRSNIVGTPLSILLSRNAELGNCTVTLCHSKTKNLEQFTRNADIIIAAIGIPHFVKKDMVKNGAIVIDVGINRIESATTKSGFQLVGDVDFENVAPICNYITPVPGGVGLMTILALMKNTLQAAQ